MIRTRKIGERFDVCGIDYIVTDATGIEHPCRECVFIDGDDCNAPFEEVGFCYKGMRTDDKQVVFKRENE